MKPRLRVDHETMRVSIRHIEHGWRATIAPRDTPGLWIACEDVAPERAVESVLEAAVREGMAVVLHSVFAAYPHPFADAEQKGLR
jgi:hypothetical protein